MRSVSETVDRHGRPGVEQERVHRKKTFDALKESEKREAMEKAGQGNLFAPKNKLPQG
jgi:hypothetical protein